MADDEQTMDTVDGFLLGLQVADHLRGLKPGATLETDGFIPLLFEIASGRTTLIESGAEIRKRASDPDLEMLRRHAQQAARAAAVRVSAWFKQMADGNK
jgi:hypothetical protein